MFDFISAAEGSEAYNFHTHTQYCDGRSDMRQMLDAAVKEKFAALGFSPHAPVPVDSPCNMHREDVPEYMENIHRYKEQGNLPKVYAGMEVDFLSPECGPHTDYYQRLGLDYIIGSVHFVPNQDGIPIDCDGSAERFIANLRDGFGGDLRYVVERYFEQVLTMIERGGFQLLGHLDKIAANASAVESEIESCGWYAAMVEDVINHAVSSGLAVEINTKAIHDRKRFFPHVRYWKALKSSGAQIVINSDAHYADRLSAGRREAFEILSKIADN